MKDPNERNWLLVLFTAWQDECLSTFHEYRLPPSAIERLPLLNRSKKNFRKRGKKTFVVLLSFISCTLVVKEAATFVHSEGWRIWRRWGFSVRSLGFQESLCTWSPAWYKISPFGSSNRIKFWESTYVLPLLPKYY